MQVEDSPVAHNTNEDSQRREVEKKGQDKRQAHLATDCYQKSDEVNMKMGQRKIERLA